MSQLLAARRLKNIYSSIGPATYRPINQVLMIITISTLIRLLSCWPIGLGVDDDYTLAISRQLQLSYFDHPPLHQWLAHFSALLFGYDVFARLPFIALFAGSTWLLFNLTRRLFGAAAGVWAAFALNVSAFFAAIAGVWILPDGPLIFCLLAAAIEVAKLMIREPTEPYHPWRRWILIGLWIGLAGLSKYHAALFAAGLGLFFVTTGERRRALAHPAPYAGAALSLAILTPVLVWNARHHWASFVFQGQRAAPALGIHPLHMLEGLIGQVGALSPWVFVPLVCAGFAASRQPVADARSWLCLCLALPSILVFTLTPLWGGLGMAHWSMPGWLFVFPLLGERLANRSRAKAWPKFWAGGSIVAMASLWAVVAVEAQTGWAARAAPALFRKGDPTLELARWSPLRLQLRRGGPLTRPGVFIATPRWRDAGKIIQALGSTTTVAVFSPDAREFAYEAQPTGLIGRDAVVVTSGRDAAADLAPIEGCFASVDDLSPVLVGPQGAPKLRLSLFYAHHLVRPCAAGP